MKFYCDGNNLAGATNIVSKALAVNKNIPILEGIKLSAHGNELTLSAYNQEIFIQKTIPADVYSEGDLVVNGRIFSEYANKISSRDNIEIEKGLNNKLSIKIGKSYSEINFFEINNFPEIGEYENEVSFTMKQSELKELLERAIFCVSLNDNRILLKSCNIELKGDNLEAVCLDGFRVGISRKVPDDKKGTFKCIILGKIVSDIIKVLSDTEDPVTVICYKNVVVFDLGHTKIRTNTVDGEFYKYDNNIPKTVKTEITVKKSDLEECLNRASIISRDSYYNTVTIDIVNNDMNIVAESEKGKIDENIECTKEGEDLKICLNNKFLQEAISKIKEDFIKMKFDGNTRPVIIKKVDGEEFICIVLPVRVV